MSFSRFLFGLGTSFGVSVILLQHITDRRLLEFRRPDEAATRSALYNNLLRKKIQEQNAPKREDEYTEKTRKTWNEALYTFSKGVSSAGGFVSSQVNEATEFGKKQLASIFGTTNSGGGAAAGGEKKEK